MSHPHRQQESTIDWQAIGARLAAAVRATLEAAQPSPERARRILDARAGQLAQPLLDRHSARDTTEIVDFELDGERYGIETRWVREVRRFGTVTPLPGVPELFVGVTNLRGEILPLIDLRCLLELASKAPSPSSYVIICGAARAEFGIVVDAVQEVSAVALDQLSPDPVGDRRVSRDYVLGIRSDATLVLNGSALLSDRRLFVEATAATQNARGEI